MVGGGGMADEMCRITEHTIVDVGILDERAGIVPFTVENKTYAEDSGQDERVSKRP